MGALCTTLYGEGYVRLAGKEPLILEANIVSSIEATMELVCMEGRH